MNPDVLCHVLKFMPSYLLLRLAGSIEDPERRQQFLSCLRCVDFIYPNQKHLHEGRGTLSLCDLKYAYKFARYLYSIPQIDCIFENATHVYFKDASLAADPRKFPKVHTAIVEGLDGRWNNLDITTLIVDDSIPHGIIRLFFCTLHKIKTLKCDNMGNIDHIMFIMPNVENIWLRWTVLYQTQPQSLPRNIVIEEWDVDSKSIIGYKMCCNFMALHSVALLDQRDLTVAKRMSAKYVWEQTESNQWSVSDECTHLACRKIPVGGLNKVTHLILLCEDIPDDLDKLEEANHLERVDVHIHADELKSALEDMKQTDKLSEKVVIRSNRRAMPLRRHQASCFDWQFPDIAESWS